MSSDSDNDNDISSVIAFLAICLLIGSCMISDSLDDIASSLTSISQAMN